MNPRPITPPGRIAIDVHEKKERRKRLFKEMLEGDITELPTMEAKAIEICNRISGPLGQPNNCPDPVQLLEDFAALVEAGLKDIRNDA